MKRKLRKEVEMFLSFITTMMIIFVGSIQDFSLSGVPIILGIVVLIAINVKILKKYGKGLIYGK